MQIKYCIHQLFKENPIDADGDCEVCKPDSDNEKCKAYYPITVTIDEKRIDI